jgi:hypothetical protein
MACPICHHPKIAVMNQRLTAGWHIGMVARQYRVDRTTLSQHREVCLHADDCMRASERPSHPVHPALCQSREAEASFDKCIDTGFKLLTQGEMASIRATPRQGTDDPLKWFNRLLPELQQCVILAKDDIQMLEVMRFKLNEIFREDDMGL